MLRDVDVDGDAKNERMFNTKGQKDESNVVVMLRDGASGANPKVVLETRLASGLATAAGCPGCLSVCGNLVPGFAIVRNWLGLGLVRPAKMPRCCAF